MRFKDYFTKDFETSDNNFYESLRTHYYRNKQEDCMEAIRKLIVQENARVIDDNEYYMETCFETASYRLVTKVTAITPIEIAIDLKITTFNLIGFGKGKKIIERLYQELDKLLTFKGISLYKG